MKFPQFDLNNSKSQHFTDASFNNSQTAGTQVG